LESIAPLLDGQEGESIWSRLHFYGNGRQRAEGTFNQKSGKERFRGRMRFRAGAEFQIDDNFSTEVRLTTENDGSDGRNPYLDYGDGANGFGNAKIGLDRFFVQWDPESQIAVRFGKMPHAFEGPPIYSEYVFDQDLNPAGVSAIWSPNAAEGAPHFDLRGAGYIAVENGNASDTHMLGVQSNGWLPLSDDLDLHAAASFSDWSSINAGAGKLLPSGNTPGNGGFGILEGFVALTYQGGPLGRTQGFVQLMKNVADDSGQDSGIAVGAKIGKSGTKGDWNLFASAFNFEANSLFGPVAQDDTPLPGTGSGTGQSGTIFGTEYTWSRNISLRLWALTTNVDSKQDPFRVRFDLSFNVK